MTADERFLITGAYGCVGAWTVRHLIEEGCEVVTFDLGEDPRRLRLVLDDEQITRVTRVHGDIAELDVLEDVLDRHSITRVIHLAALQVPFCRADPPLGARVNVVGTVNVFEAAKRRRDRIAHVVYASSIAVYAAREVADAPPTDTGGAPPSTIYGVYKRANEGTASVYFEEEGVSSIGLRPHTVYGPGRDQGLTSAPTMAMLAAAAGLPYRIPFGGRCQMQYARDVAAAFVHASRADYTGATVHNLPGHAVSMAEVVQAIEAAAPEATGTIGYGTVGLPFPEEVDARSLAGVIGEHTDISFAAGVRDAIERFRGLLESGLVTIDALPRTESPTSTNTAPDATNR
jgi:nucleoside-diphosphate-sugar epimerase